MSTKPMIGRLEIHVTHVCNLACESCSHYSNHGHKGHLDLEQADRWLADWSPRVAVRAFTLLGGEPTVHPKLVQFVPLVRKHWPEARISIITNGFFLDRHPALPLALAAAGNAEVRLSVHHHSPEYRDRIKPSIDLLRRWRADHRISVIVADFPALWTRRYIGYGDEMEPFEDGAPRESWQICPARNCMQLFEGKLWKCAPIAYLQLQKRKFRLSPKWDRYLEYEPLRPDCDDDALAAFVAREDESICSMCSSRPIAFDLPNPIRGVSASRSSGARAT